MATEGPSYASADKMVEVAEESVRGGIFLISGTAIGTILLAVASIVIARLLGPEDYGIYTIALVMPSFFVFLVDMGVNPALIRYLAQFRSRGEEDLAVNIIRAGFLYKMAMAVLFSLVSMLLADAFAAILNRPQIGPLIQLASLLILLQAVFYTSHAVFVGCDRMDRSAIMMVVQAVTKLIVAPALIIIGFGVVGALLGHLAGFVISGAIALTFAYNIYRDLAPVGRSYNMGLSLIHI